MFAVRGEYQREQDNDAEAVESFSRALRLDPGHIWSLLSMARALGQIGKGEVREAVATHALDRYPASRAAYYLRGTSLQGQGKYDLAVEDFEMVHKLKPDDYLGSFWAGMALLKKGDEAAALEKLRMAAEINSGSGWVPLELAEVFMRLDQHDLAMQQLNKSIENCERVLNDYEFAQRLSTKAHLQRARLQLKAGKKEAAQSDVDTAYHIARDHSQRHAMKEVAWFLATGPTELRDPEKGIPLAREALQQWTKSRRDPLLTLGVLNYETSNYAEAMETFETINEFGLHQLPRVHFLLAATNWQLANKDEARKWYDRGVEEDVGTFRDRASKLMGKREAEEDEDPPEQVE